jgi:hypothetical protein
MTQYEEMDRRAKDDIYNKLGKMHETLIRLEPFLKDVEELKTWKNGGDILPGARAQLWILWVVFLAVLGKVFKGN